MMLPPRPGTALGQHPAQGRARTEKRAGQVDAYHPIPVGQRQLVHGRAGADPRAGGEHVHPTVGLDRLSGHRGHLTLVADIAVNGDCLTAFGTHQIDRLRGPFVTNVADHHMRTLARKAYRAGAPNARRASGDDCSTTFQVAHRTNLCRIELGNCRLHFRQQRS